MKLHDDIARKAYLAGEKSGLYRQAAQKHANAFWVYFASSVAVWWFVGQWWALLPGALALFVATQSISATSVAQRIEKYESQSKNKGV